MSADPSIMHGTNDMRMAVFPTFFRAVLLMPSPARDRITISAKDFKNGESSQRISGELSLIKTEQRMPKTTIPRTAGSLIFENSFEKIHPPANMITKMRFKFISINCFYFANIVISVIAVVNSVATLICHLNLLLVIGCVNNIWVVFTDIFMKLSKMQKMK